MKTTLLACIGFSCAVLANYPATESGAQLILNSGFISGKDMERDTNEAQDPQPVLYWGANQSGGRAFRSEIRIYAVYPVDVPESGKFEVLSLEFFIQGEGRVYYISGDTLTEDFQIRIRDLPSGHLIRCSARVRDERGTIHVITGEWELQ